MLESAWPRERASIEFGQYRLLSHGLGQDFVASSTVCRKLGGAHVASLSSQPLDEFARADRAHQLHLLAVLRRSAVAQSSGHRPGQNMSHAQVRHEQLLVGDVKI